MISRPSPNHGPRPCAPDTVLIHYTGMETASASLDRLCDPAAEVSAHFLIDEDGTLYELVHPERRAWHAGVSHWAGRDNANDWSIGIELQYLGHEYGIGPYAEPQITALLKLLGDLRGQYDIAAHQYIGHSDVAPDRKIDPGELFPWGRLAQAGYGIFPDIPFQEDDGRLSDMSLVDASEHLTAIGYAVGGDMIMGELDVYKSGKGFKSALIAFQRHFLSRTPNGVLDLTTAEQLQRVKKAFETARGKSDKTV